MHDADMSNPIHFYLRTGKEISYLNPPPPPKKRKKNKKKTKQNKKNFRLQCTT